ncbi:MAG: hypothetical protein JEZ02_08450 [Desulfatibacillum sp.]|nr:hypothetical protein [Desulfatibacillum sp.]
MKSKSIPLLGRSAPVRLFLAALSLCFVMGLDTAFGQDKAEAIEAVEAIGVSRIFQGNVQNARQAATEDSFERAVARVVASILPADVLASNFQAVSGLVLANTEKYVQGFQVMAEAQTSTHLRIMTRVRVDHFAIQEALRAGGALATQDNLPVILFLVNEKELGQNAPRHWWGKAVSQNLTPYTETIMARVIAEKGFPSVDGRDAIRTMVSGTQFNPERFDLTAAMTLARDAQAQVVVFGDAAAVHASPIPGTNMASYEATISVQAVNADTGEQVATSTQMVSVISDTPQAGSQEAMTKAATQAARELSLGLMAVYQTKPQGPVSLEIKVLGISPLANFVAFRQALKDNTEGVSRMLLKWMTDREALLSVEYKGLSQKLARDLTLKAFDRFSVHVSYIGENQMELELIPKDQGGGAAPGIVEELPRQ